tara:strand:+ start:508 stop:1089 length:582 start_codon:yes stop_codon:yes gene_type:complete
MSKNFILLVSPAFLGGNLVAAEAGMPQLNPEFWASQAFWLVLVFVTIYILISKIFIPKIKNNIDARESKIRKDLEEAKSFKEEAEKKFKEYEKVIQNGKNDAKKIISESRIKLNDNIKLKKDEIQKKIEEETLIAEKEIKKFKSDSINKISSISEGVVADVIKNIFGEELNSSSIKASVTQSIKEHKEKNYGN